LLDQLFQLRSYLRYLLVARDEHHIHSPFVYTLYTKTVCAGEKHSKTEDIEKLRKKYLNDKRIIEVTDYGSGSTGDKRPQRSIASITRYSLKSRRFARLISRLVAFQQPKVAIELGTSLGVTTLYQLAALEQSSVLYTFEGSEEIAKIAADSFKDSHKNVKLITGNIDDTLAKVIDGIEKLDYVFFDANHRLAPTVHYFEVCKKKLHEDSLCIFDDIHRSKEMSEAWEMIKKDDRTIVTVDLFHIGLVFFKKNQPNQHFVLKF
jgi:predicted O-methyltransferase YrrM